MLRKLPTPPKYERKFYKHPDKKKKNRYNKHYIRFQCGTHELIIYDKTYQVKENGIVVAYEKLPEGILRFEVHCERAYLHKIEKEYKNPATIDFLWIMIQESQSRIIKHFSKCFPDCDFMQMEKITEAITSSGFKKKNKDTMVELVGLLQRIQSVDKALDKLNRSGNDTIKVLDRFAKLGISPIPLRVGFCALQIPGPVQLLRDVSSGSIEVEYTNKKYK